VISDNPLSFFFRTLVKKGKVEERIRPKTLSQLRKDDVVEVLSHESIDTCNGPAISLKVILPEHKASREETSMTIPFRFKEECDKKVPCLLLYDGVKKLDGNKKCHQVAFRQPDDPTLFHESDQEDEDKDNESDDEEELSIEDFTPLCPTCGLKGELCYGSCPVCHEHQPLNGSQCRCVLRR
jgi:hypothetical protein